MPFIIKDIVVRNLPITGNSNAWLCPPGVTEIFLTPSEQSTYEESRQLPLPITVVPNTSYVINIATNGFYADNLNSFGSLFFWTGSSRLNISWVE